MPPINRFIDDLLDNILPARAHCPNFKSECDTCSAAETPIQRSEPGWSPGCRGGAYRWFDEVRHHTLQELHGWLHLMRRRTVLPKYDMVAELLTNFWEKTSMQQSFFVVACIYLGAFVVKWIDVLPALDTATDAITLSLKCLWPSIRRRLAMDDFFLAVSYMRSFLVMGGWTMNIFSSENGISSTLSRHRPRSNVFQHLTLLWQSVSDSSWAFCVWKRSVADPAA